MLEKKNPISDVARLRTEVDLQLQQFAEGHTETARNRRISQWTIRRLQSV